MQSEILGILPRRGGYNSGTYLRGIDMLRTACAIAGLLVFGGAASLGGQTVTQNPFASPADIAAGAKFFRSHCGRCHGRSGTGGRGPDLTERRYRYATNDTELFDLIYNGIPVAGMSPPSSGQKHKKQGH